MLDVTDLLVVSARVRQQGGGDDDNDHLFQEQEEVATARMPCRLDELNVATTRAIRPSVQVDEGRIVYCAAAFDFVGPSSTLAADLNHVCNVLDKPCNQFAFPYVCHCQGGEGGSHDDDVEPESMETASDSAGGTGGTGGADGGANNKEGGVIRARLVLYAPANAILCGLNRVPKRSKVAETLRRSLDNLGVDGAVGHRLCRDDCLQWSRDVGFPRIDDWRVLAVRGNAPGFPVAAAAAAAAAAAPAPSLTEQCGWSAAERAQGMPAGIGAALAQQALSQSLSAVRESWRSNATGLFRRNFERQHEQRRQQGQGPEPGATHPRSTQGGNRNIVLGNEEERDDEAFARATAAVAAEAEAWEKQMQENAQKRKRSRRDEHGHGHEREHGHGHEHGDGCGAKSDKGGKGCNVVAKKNSAGKPPPSKKRKPSSPGQRAATKAKAARPQRKQDDDDGPVWAFVPVHPLLLSEEEEEDAASPTQRQWLARVEQQLGADARDALRQQPDLLVDEARQFFVDFLQDCRYVGAPASAAWPLHVKDPDEWDTAGWLANESDSDDDGDEDDHDHDYDVTVAFTQEFFFQSAADARQCLRQFAQWLRARSDALADTGDGLVPAGLLAERLAVDAVFQSDGPSLSECARPILRAGPKAFKVARNGDVPEMLMLPLPLPLPLPLDDEENNDDQNDDDARTVDLRRQLKQELSRHQCLCGRRAHECEALRKLGLAKTAPAATSKKATHLHECLALHVARLSSGVRDVITANGGTGSRFDESLLKPDVRSAQVVAAVVEGRVVCASQTTANGWYRVTDQPALVAEMKGALDEMQLPPEAVPRSAPFVWERADGDAAVLRLLNDAVVPAARFLVQEHQSFRPIGKSQTDALEKWVDRLLVRRHRAALVRELRVLEKVHRPGFEESLDRQNDRLTPFTNGVWDHRVGQFRPGQPSDLVSTTCGYPFVDLPVPELLANPHLQAVRQLMHDILVVPTTKNKDSSNKDSKNNNGDGGGNDGSGGGDGNGNRGRSNSNSNNDNASSGGGGGGRSSSSNNSNSNGNNNGNNGNRQLPPPDESKFHLVEAALAMSLRHTDEAVFLVFQGNGGAGKTTLVSVFAALNGQRRFFATLPATMLTKDEAAAHSATPQLMAMRGARVASMSEPNVNDQFLTGILCRLTGGNPIYCRRMHSDQDLSFTPRAIFLFDCNKLPALAHDTSLRNALFRRIYLVLCRRQFKFGQDRNNRQEQEQEQEQEQQQQQQQQPPQQQPQSGNGPAGNDQRNESSSVVVGRGMLPKARKALVWRGVLLLAPYLLRKVWPEIQGRVDRGEQPLPLSDGVRRDTLAMLAENCAVSLWFAEILDASVVDGTRNSSRARQKEAISASRADSVEPAKLIRGPRWKRSEQPSPEQLWDSFQGWFGANAAQGHPACVRRLKPGRNEFVAMLHGADYLGVTEEKAGGRQLRFPGWGWLPNIDDFDKQPGKGK